MAMKEQAYQAFRYRDITFRMMRDGRIMASMQHAPERAVHQLLDKHTGIPWYPAIRRNFHDICRDMVDFKDSESLERLREENRQALEAIWRLERAAPALYRALMEARKDLVAYQHNARSAALTDSRWENVADIIQPTIDAADKALKKAEGKGTKQ